MDSERLAEIRRAQEMFARLKPVEAPNRAFIMINEYKNKSEFR